MRSAHQLPLVIIPDIALQRCGGRHELKECAGLQEIAGSAEVAGQYESHTHFTLPGLYRVSQVGPVLRLSSQCTSQSAWRRSLVHCSCRQAQASALSGALAADHRAACRVSMSLTPR